MLHRNYKNKNQVKGINHLHIQQQQQPATPPQPTKRIQPERQEQQVDYGTKMEQQLQNLTKI